MERLNGFFDFPLKKSQMLGYCYVYNNFEIHRPMATAARPTRMLEPV